MIILCERTFSVMQAAEEEEAAEQLLLQQQQQSFQSRQPRTARGSGAFQAWKPVGQEPSPSQRDKSVAFDLRPRVRPEPVPAFCLWL